MMGPTGTGKTTLAKQLAHRFGAEIVHVSYGSWIVAGAHDENPTLQMIMRRAASARFVVLFIDEIDKFLLAGSQGDSWTIGTRCELWSVLDRALPWASLATHPKLRPDLPESMCTPEALEGHFNSRVFIVGAGTWQHLHRPKSAVGFGPTEGPEEIDATMLNQRAGVPEEVIRRFHTDFIHLEYPTVTELGELIKADGLLELAASHGHPIDVEQLHREITLRGMSVLTSLKTSLLIKSERKKGRGLVRDASITQP